MRRVCLSLLVLALGAGPVRPADEPDYLATLRELAGGGPLEKSPKAREYLKRLTIDQTLTALRQLGAVVEAETPVERWPESALPVMILMEFYAEPSGRLSDDAFMKLAGGIANKKESDFFRYALAMQVGGEYRRRLTDKQKDLAIATCVTALHDRQSPSAVRGRCGYAATMLLLETYDSIVSSDDGVKELRHRDPERARNVDSLIASGQLRLTSDTRQQLAPWQRRIRDLRKSLVVIQEEGKESAPLKKQAAMYTKWLGRPALLNGAEPDSNSPKD